MRRRWWIPALLWAALSLALWPLRGSLTGEAIAAWTPRQAWLAAMVLLGLYVVKGLTAALPITALEAAGGLLFPLPAAMALGMCGVTAAQAAPYLLGRRRQEDLSALAEQHPVLRALEPGEAPGRRVFLLRLAGVLPGDLVSLYLGAAGTPWRAYLAGGLLGNSPRVLSATVLGAALWDLGGARFWASCIFGWALTAAALLLWGRDQALRRDADGTA
ncbi:TVP38/TMEM64 family protein [uncultured Oscillibacter sp.]|uniref:TVP38/TMEM64 family protein n=1 Tax=uncultured Oscillibacter sp. TaxID=876091 RepID=UPI002600632C|nr:VTT domain-containing protein [uncultured Oscillibacter sp.]